MRGVTPKGVTSPRGLTSVIVSPVPRPSESASRAPGMMPSPAAKRSTALGPALSATEVSLAMSSPDNPRTSTPDAPDGLDASAWPSTKATANFTPATPSMTVRMPS